MFLDRWSVQWQLTIGNALPETGGLIAVTVVVCYDASLGLARAVRWSLLGSDTDLTTHASVHHIGPVVDVQLKSSVPAWRIQTPVRVAQSIRAGHVTVEVQQGAWTSQLTVT